MLENKQVEIINYEMPESDVIQTVEDLKTRKNCTVKAVSQQELLEKYENWNWIKHCQSDIDFYEKYIENSQSIEIYYNHEKAQKEFGDQFWFDGGSKLSIDRLDNSNENDSWHVLDRKLTNLYSVHLKPKISGFFPKNLELEFPQGSQGLKIFNTNYKIIWNKVFRAKYRNFSFSDYPDLLFADNQLMLISSNNKQEILYIFGLLNSDINLRIIHLTSNAGDHEQLGTLVSITAIKNFIRVPILNTPEKLELKQKLIQKAQDLLESENTHLENLVDFDSYDTLLPQKFDWWSVHDGNLFLTLNNHDSWFEIINKTNENAIYIALEDIYGEPVKIVENGIELNQLKKTTIFDKNRQNQIKKEMDEIVFELYEMNEYKTKIEVS